MVDDAEVIALGRRELSVSGELKPDVTLTFDLDAAPYKVFASVLTAASEYLEVHASDLAEDDSVHARLEVLAAERVSELLEKRIGPAVNGREIVVLDGDGLHPDSSVLLRTVRESYG